MEEAQSKDTGAIKSNILQKKPAPAKKVDIVDSLNVYVY